MSGDAPGEKILEAATRLFCREGIHATGIDRILAEAGAAKMTLYKHFGSKVGLVHAVLVREGDMWRAWFRETLEARGGSPRERLLAVFDVLGQWFGGEDYFGCAFINAVAEHDKNEDDVRALALEHKRQVLDLIRELAEEADARDPELLTHQLGLLMDGAIVAALVLRSAEPARIARSAAETIVDAACREA